MANRVDAEYFSGLRTVLSAAMRPLSSYKDDPHARDAECKTNLAG